MSIPIFTAQLEKSREATDLANIRSAYAEASAALLSEEGTTTGSDLISAVTYNAATASAAATAVVTVTLKQGVDGWTTTSLDVGGVDLTGTTPKANGTCEITVSADPNTLPTFTFS